VISKKDQDCLIKEILADDKLARVAARILRLKTIGCLGVIIKAYEAGVITRSEAANAIQELVKTGLWISPEVLGEVLRMTKEISFKLDHKAFMAICVLTPHVKGVADFGK